MTTRFCHCATCRATCCDYCHEVIDTPYYEYWWKNMPVNMPAHGILQGSPGNMCALCSAKYADQIPIPQHVAVFLLRFGLLKGGAEIACRDYSPDDGDYVGLENNEWECMAEDGQNHFVIRLNQEFKEQ